MRMNFNAKLTGAVLAIVVLAVVGVSVVTSLTAKDNLDDLGEANLVSASNALMNTIGMQNRITQEKVDSDLKLMAMEIQRRGEARLDADDPVTLTIVNQNTKASKTVTLPTMKLGDYAVTNDFSLVDETQDVVGGTATIFQAIEGGLLRVSTNVLKLDGDRAVGTYIPENSAVYQTIMRGDIYRGKAFVVNAWYITGYAPIRNAQGRVVGAYYVGRTILSPQLQDALAETRVAGKGNAYVFNEAGEILFHPDPAMLTKNMLKDFAHGASLVEHTGSVVQYDFNGMRDAIVQYFEPWGWYVGLSVSEEELLLGSDREMFIAAGVVGGGAILLALGVVLLSLRRLLRPLRELAAVTERIADGDLNARASYDGDDVIGATIQSVNRMVAELKRRLGFAQGVLNGLTVPCGVMDPAFKVQWVNPQMLALLEKPGLPEDYVGMDGGEFYHGDRSRETLSSKAIKERRAQQTERDMRLPSGKSIHVIVTSTPFEDMDGQPLGAISQWIDLTDIHAQQQLVARQNERIEAAAREAEEISVNLTSMAEELSTQVDEAYRNADAQKDRAGETATAMNQMNATVLEVARNAGDAAEGAEQTRKRAESGSSVVAQVVAASKEVQSHADSLKESMRELGEQAAGIGNVVNVIEDIADQTNLLALNAAIEAARAGDAGRGFAVVADEVRKLAEKTMGATKEVGEAIRAIQAAADRNVDATDKTTETVVMATNLATESGDALREIVSLVHGMTDQVRGIATASEQQSAASDQVTRATEEIGAAAVETSRAMEEAAQAVQELARLATALNEIIDGMRRQE